MSQACNSPASTQPRPSTYNGCSAVVQVGWPEPGLQDMVLTDEMLRRGADDLSAAGAGARYEPRSRTAPQPG
jgi:hypothetical protein